jgi:hypothetical protein
MRNVLVCALLAALCSPAFAAVTSTSEGALADSLNGLIKVNDLLSGLIATELPGDTGWHPANTAPADQLPALTDDLGIRPPDGTGLMNDFPGVGIPAKQIQYALGGPKDVARIGILSGNEGKDGRVFSTTVINYSTDGGNNFNLLGYFQSHQSGTLNQTGAIGSVYLDIAGDAAAPLLTGVTHLQFMLYAVDNTGGQMRDPFEGVNPFTGVDDGLTAAFVSPLIFELDVVEVPEPATLGLLCLGGLLLRRRTA